MTKVSASWDWRRLLQVISVITLACAILGGLADEADAKRKKKRVAAYSPPYAEMVVDINSGRVLRAVNADEPRFPASITKVMTLYLLFEQIERGRMNLNTPLEVSAFAAAQSPSKLGLRPGSTIAVEDAILALVTKSANDVAVTVAENIGGSQDRFRADDDEEGPPARHEQHHLPQCLRPAQSAAAHHGARSRAPRHRDEARFPSVL